MSAPYNIPDWEGASLDNPDDEYATMGCVEGSETIRYTINDVEYIESFRKAHERVSKLYKTSNSGKSEYINVEDKDVKIFDSYTGGFVQVKKFIKNPDAGNWRTVKFNNGYCLTATADHPLPVIGKGRTFVGDMRIGDAVKVAPCKSNLVHEKNKFNTRYFKDNAWLLGILLTDSAYSSSQITISLGADEKDIVSRVEEVCESLGYRASVKEHNRGSKGNYIDV